MVGSLCNCEAIVDCALQVVDVHLQRGHVAAEAFGGAGAALLEADVAGLVHDAEHLLRALGRELPARALAGDRLVLPDVADGAELRRPFAAGVDGDDRDAGVDGRLDRVLQGVRVGHRDHDAVDALVDRRVDELRLPLRVAVALVVDGDAEILAGLLGPVLDDVPERVTGGAVGDDREAEVAATTATAAAVAGIAAVRVAAGGARGGEEERCSHRERQQSLGSGHGSPPVLAGAAARSLVSSPRIMPVAARRPWPDPRGAHRTRDVGDPF
jgi:hypothetical protein